jgi:hypothetical protein
MKLLERLGTDYKHWLGVLFLTVLVNVPFLSPRLVFVHDTLSCFISFHYYYSQLFFYNELPKWIPLIGYGIPVSLDSLKPTDFVALGFGWLIGLRDALLVFKIGCVLAQCVFALGLFLLGRKVFASMLTVWLVCLGGLLTNSWLFNWFYNFSSFYMLPLFYFFILEFLENKKLCYLWLAANVEVLSLLGTPLYMAPLHLLVFLAFLVPYLVREPSILLVLLRWRTYASPLFFLFIAFSLIVADWVTGFKVDYLAPGRDAATGHVTPEGFIEDYRTSLAGRFTALVVGHLSHADKTNFVGLLPLIMAVYALARVRSTRFLAFVSAAFVLVWFGIGGWFSLACYYSVPLMKVYRNLDVAFTLLKVFLLILGGFGFDRLLRECSVDAPREEYAADRRLPRWSKILIASLCLCFLVDLAVNHRRNDFTLLPLRDAVSKEDDNFAVESYASWLYMARFLLYAGSFFILHRLLKKLPQDAPALLRFVRMVLPTIYLVDIAVYYLQMAWQAPYLPTNIAIGETLQVRRLTYAPERFDWTTVPEFVQNAVPVIESKRGGVPGTVTYASVYLFLGLDPVDSRFRLDYATPGIRKMIEARGGRVTADLSGRPPFELPKDPAFRRSLGEKTAKIRKVHTSVCAASDVEARTLFQALTDPDKALVLTGKCESFPASEPGKDDEAVPKVTLFTGNRVVIELGEGEGTPGWLYYADAYHPDWKATVDGRPADVCCANLGFKAVHLDKGAREVVFYFDDGVRGWVRTGMIWLASCCGIILVAALIFPPGISVRRGAESIAAAMPSVAVNTEAKSWRALRYVTAGTVPAMLIVAFWLVPGLNTLTLTIAAAVAVVLLFQVKSHFR